MRFSVTAPRVSGVVKRSRRVQEIVMLTLIEETPAWTRGRPVARRGTPPPQDSHVTKLSILTRFVTHVRSRSKRSVLRLRSDAHAPAPKRLD